MPKVVLFSGHMVDSPDRPAPRFPANKEPVVRDEINSTLADWQVGPGDICICGGARGGDILFAEQCLNLGADLWLFLPLEMDAFLDASVRLPPKANSAWEDRFKRILAQAKAHWPKKTKTTENPFAANNTRMIDAAISDAGGAPIYLLLLWDGKAGDGEGGTGDVAERVRCIAKCVEIIDPTHLCVVAD